MTEKDGRDLRPLLGDSSAQPHPKFRAGFHKPFLGLGEGYRYLEYTDLHGKRVRFKTRKVEEHELPPDFPKGLVRWAALSATAGRARQATQEPYGHRQQSATEWRPAGTCPLGDAGALRASTAERDRKAARRDVPVRRRRSLTGIDSRARDFPSPQTRNEWGYQALVGGSGDAVRSAPIDAQTAGILHELQRAVAVKPLLQGRIVRQGVCPAQRRDGHMLFGGELPPQIRLSDKAVPFRPQ